MYRLLLLVLPIVIVVIGVDAHVRRARRDRDRPAIAAVCKRLPSGDLALSGGARWLRTPSLEEPGAAFQDGIAVPDPDPAGGAMAPPVGAWGTR
ncbi:MAG TPA: hypothetical protein VGH28_30450 [Polyangiaceae bacterium]|jgi:hypothetical protein